MCSAAELLDRAACRRPGPRWRARGRSRVVHESLDARDVFVGTAESLDVPHLRRADRRVSGGGLLCVLARARRNSHQQFCAAPEVPRAGSGYGAAAARADRGQGARRAPRDARGAGVRMAPPGACTNGWAFMSPVFAATTTPSRSKTRWCCGETRTGWRSEPVSFSQLATGQ